MSLTDPTLDQSSAEARRDFSIPIGSPYPLFTDGKGNVSCIPSQLLNSAPAIDESAAYSVLQYGAIVPPLSPWRGIQRLLPGFRYENLLPASSCINNDAHCDISDAWQAKDVSQQAAIIEARVDAALQKAVGEDQQPILLFSGGVDSGFLASRLRTLGYIDTLLLNASFGDNDPEAALAQRMAQTLRLRFKQVRIPTKSLRVLEHPGKHYSQPFGDSTVAHASAIVEEISSLLSGERRVIIDGTGADGAFGMTAKARRWMQLYRLPRLIRRTAQAIYQRSLWTKTGSWESALRPAARAAKLSMPAAAIAQNGLAEIFYANETYAAKIDGYLNDWLRSTGVSSASALVVAADLAVTCANVFAQKCREPLGQLGHRVLFPFLDTHVTDVSLAAAAIAKDAEPKASLKYSLAKHVPREMVYRTKSAFSDPNATLFGEPGFSEMLRATVDSSAPLAGLLVRDQVTKACSLLKARNTLPAQTLNLLWAAVFTDRWYRTSPQT